MQLLRINLQLVRGQEVKRKVVKLKIIRKLILTLILILMKAKLIVNLVWG